MLEDTYENLDNSQKEINAYKADIAKLRRSNEQLQLQLITEQEAARSEAVLQSSQNILSPPTICYLRPSVKADSPVDIQEKVESETLLLEKVRSPSSGKFVTPSPHPSADNNNMIDDGTGKILPAEGWVSMREGSFGYLGTVLHMQYHSTLAVPDFFFLRQVTKKL